MSKSVFHAALGAAALLASMGTTSAFAHATLETQTAKADSYFKAVMRIPHGCEGKATNDVIIELPDGFYSAKPMAHHGFEMSVETGAYHKPLTLHGREKTEGIRKVTWSGGVVEDWAYDEFIVFGRIGNVEAGETLYFKTTQLCGDDARVVWDEIPVEGEKHPAKPAPSLKIVANADAHGHGHGHNHGDKKAEHEDHGKMVLAGDIHIEGSWTRATPPNAKAGGAFLKLTNKGHHADRLIGASSSVSKVVEVHEMAMVNDVMKMQELTDGLAIEPGATVELKPGGYHLMLIGIHNPIAKGDMVKITLEFEKAGKVDVMFPAAELGAPGMDHSNH